MAKLIGINAQAVTKRQAYGTTICSGKAIPGKVAGQEEVLEDKISMATDLDLARLEEKVQEAWSFIADAHIQDARFLSESLIREILHSFDARKENPALLNILIQSYHVAGYAVSMSSRAQESHYALYYFQEMRRLTRLLRNDTLLVIALSYEGDTYRRLKKLEKARSCLQKAREYTLVDQAAQGNCAQLLGRIYFLRKDMVNFEKVMAQAEAIARTIDPVKNSLYGQYCLGTVYLDYARSYHELGRFQEAMEYLQRAEREFPPTPHWTTLLIATRGILLVKSGEIQQGMPLVLKAIELGLEHGNQRLLDNFHKLRHYFTQKSQEINNARVFLDQALEGASDF